MFKYTISHGQRFIRPAAEAVGPLHPIHDLNELYGIDDVLRAVDAGLAVYDAGDLLLACGSDIKILRELNAPTEAAA
jgi:hypothetical protein